MFDLIAQKPWFRVSQPLRFRADGALPELALLDLPLGVADTPPMELHEDETQAQVQADLPGWSARNLTVTFCDEVLRIAGEQAGGDEEGSAFERTIILGPFVDPRSARAEFADGRLTVTFDKWRQPAGRTQIPVRDLGASASAREHARTGS
jgi:HSP20 family molecular chaperone IbpA